MRKFLLIISIFSLLTLNSCLLLFISDIPEPKPKVFFDEFTNTKSMTVEQYLNPVEYNAINYAKITYKKTLTSDDSEVIIYFIINRNVDSFDISESAFASINNATYSIPVIKDGYEKNMTQKTTTTYSSEDSKQMTNVTNSSKIEEKFHINVTPEMVDDILETNEIMFRFYFGPDHVTYYIKNKNLERVKELLLIKNV